MPVQPPPRCCRVVKYLIDNIVNLGSTSKICIRASIILCQYMHFIVCTGQIECPLSRRLSAVLLIDRTADALGFISYEVPGLKKC